MIIDVNNNIKIIRPISTYNKFVKVLNSNKPIINKTLDITLNTKYFLE